MDEVKSRMVGSGTSSQPRRVAAESLRALVAEIFARVGSDEHEAERMAHYLVESNLAGHDSHGVIRVSYFDYVQKGQVTVNQHANVVHDNDTMIVVDGGGGFGQIIAEEAMQLAIEASGRAGVCVLALRNCGHLGRIGDWPLMATRSGRVSLHFANTSGFGLLVAPFGGIDRRLSANPIAAGIPRPNNPPIILDISTASIAEGKLKVARNRGDRIPKKCIIDVAGRSIEDPDQFYTDPPGAILPFGGHKGYGLGVIAELFAGALTGSGCSKPGADRLINGMLSIVIDPEKIPREMRFEEEVDHFVTFLKTSRQVDPDASILVPGEIEAATRQRRLVDGVPLDVQTCSELLATAEQVDVPTELVDALR